MKKLFITFIFCFYAFAYADKPNFIIVFTDDQGYADLGVMGAQDFNTPNLDKLAKDSIVAKSFYTSTVCTPARAALQLGKYHANIRHEPANNPYYNKRSVYFPDDLGGMSDSERTIAEVLKPAGYASAMIGKWHLGCLAPYLPTNQGYDYYYGVPYSNDMWLMPNAKYAKDLKITNGKTFEQLKALENNKDACKAEDIVPLMRNDEVIELPARQEMLTERYFDEAIKFVDKSKADKKPFYICITPSMPHVPLYASGKFRGKTKRGIYGDVIEEIDFNFGRLVKHLETEGLLENTVIVFTSDNGPWLVKKEMGGSATPLRNGKATLFEGGIRVPCLIYYPKLFKAGESFEIMATIDILPTFASLAGAKPPEGIDGVDLSAYLSGKVAQSPRQEFLIYTIKYELAGLRYKDWKVIFESPLPPFAKNVSKADKPPFLFNIKEDISESKNLAESNAEKFAELKMLAFKLDKGFKKSTVVSAN